VTPVHAGFGRGRLVHLESRVTKTSQVRPQQEGHDLDHRGDPVGGEVVTPVVERNRAQITQGFLHKGDECRGGQGFSPEGCRGHRAHMRLERLDLCGCMCVCVCVVWCVYDDDDEFVRVCETVWVCMD
jgi:hypothetical protein